MSEIREISIFSAFVLLLLLIPTFFSWCRNRRERRQPRHAPGNTQECLSPPLVKEGPTRPRFLAVSWFIHFLPRFAAKGSSVEVHGTPSKRFIINKGQVVGYDNTLKKYDERQPIKPHVTPFEERILNALRQEEKLLASSNDLTIPFGFSNGFDSTVGTLDPESSSLDAESTNICRGLRKGQGVSASSLRRFLKSTSRTATTLLGAIEAPSMPSASATDDVDDINSEDEEPPTCAKTEAGLLAAERRTVPAHRSLSAAEALLWPSPASDPQEKAVASVVASDPPSGSSLGEDLGSNGLGGTSHASDNAGRSPSDGAGDELLGGIRRGQGGGDDKGTFRILHLRRRLLSS